MISGKELARRLGVSPPALSSAVKRGHLCGGHNVAQWAVYSPSGRVVGYEPPIGIVPQGASESLSRDAPVSVAAPGRDAVSSEEGNDSDAVYSPSGRVVGYEPPIAAPVSVAAPGRDAVSSEEGNDSDAEHNTDTLWFLGPLAIAGLMALLLSKRSRVAGPVADKPEVAVAPTVVGNPWAEVGARVGVV